MEIMSWFCLLLHKRQCYHLTASKISIFFTFLMCPQLFHLFFLEEMMPKASRRRIIFFYFSFTNCCSIKYFIESVRQLLLPPLLLLLWLLLRLHSAISTCLLLFLSFLFSFSIEWFKSALIKCAFIKSYTHRNESHQFNHIPCE